MARAEQRVRIVVNVTFDEEDPCPVHVGRGQGLVLATWLAGAEVDVDDVGPALEGGEQERSAFKAQLERSIGRLMHRLGRETWMTTTIGAPRRGTDARDRHFEDVGVLNGLTDAYRYLTGLPRATAERNGLEACAVAHLEESGAAE